LEVVSSFCRDSILVKEKGKVSLMMNPDYEEKINKAERVVSLGWLMSCLRKIDYAVYGLRKNLNFNLLISAFFAHFKEWDYV
jgi:DNA polymerase-3 subunit delta'